MQYVNKTFSIQFNSIRPSLIIPSPFTPSPVLSLHVLLTFSLLPHISLFGVWVGAITPSPPPSWLGEFQPCQPTRSFTQSTANSCFFFSEWTKQRWHFSNYLVSVAVSRTHHSNYGAIHVCYGDYERSITPQCSMAVRIFVGHYVVVFFFFFFYLHQ